ncbi:hypothetical protein EDD86DRAFT_250314 [Gorgonomyces haynaldii]|nr:hypothetical protein EDD86DRAFT_250314 [Gorgonomyces haynaldii]
MESRLLSVIQEQERIIKQLQERVNLLESKLGLPPSVLPVRQSMIESIASLETIDQDADAMEPTLMPKPKQEEPESPVSPIRESTTMDLSNIVVSLKRLDKNQQGQKQFVLLLSEKNGQELYCLESHTAVIRPIPEEIYEQIQMGNDHANLLQDYRKKGYLLKKGKALGGWKLRFYMIEKANGIMYYGESPTLMLGPLVDLHFSYVCRQPPVSEKPSFCIAQYRKQNFSMTATNPSGSSELNQMGLPDGKIENKFILYAETEQDRDDWVRCLAGQIQSLRPNDKFNNQELEQLQKQFSTEVSASKTSLVGSKNNLKSNPELTHVKNVSTQRKISEDKTPPAVTRPVEKPKLDLPRPSTQTHSTTSHKSAEPEGPHISSSSMERQFRAKYVDDHQRVMNQPTPPSFIHEPVSPGRDGTKLSKKKTNFVKDWLKKKGTSSSQEAPKPQKPTFGVTLEESLAISFVPDYPLIPSVIYRSFEEEGLYQGDVNLLEGDAFYDVHAISGLLKLYLRELAEPILSKEHRMDFFQISDRQQKVEELSKLLKMIPQVNFHSLKVLLGHLIRVVKISDKNKMNVRNISIVFSPTLGMPAGIFTLMMAEYPTLFPEDKVDKIDKIPEQRLIEEEAVKSWENLEPNPEQKKRSDRRKPMTRTTSQSVKQLELQLKLSPEPITYDHATQKTF